MKIDVTRFNSETCIRASVEGYKEAFPLSNLSNKNIEVDIWLDAEDTPDSIRSLIYLIAQSHVALVVVHMSGTVVNGILTQRGFHMVKVLEESFDHHLYTHLSEMSSPHIIVYGMLHPGLVYTE